VLAFSLLEVTLAGLLRKHASVSCYFFKKMKRLIIPSQKNQAPHDSIRKDEVPHYFFGMKIKCLIIYSDKKFFCYKKL